MIEEGHRIASGCRQALGPVLLAGMTCILCGCLTIREKVIYNEKTVASKMRNEVSPEEDIRATKLELTAAEKIDFHASVENFKTCRKIVTNKNVRTVKYKRESLFFRLGNPSWDVNFWNVMVAVLFQFIPHLALGPGAIGTGAWLVYEGVSSSSNAYLWGGIGAMAGGLAFSALGIWSLSKLRSSKNRIASHTIKIPGVSYDCEQYPGSDILVEMEIGIKRIQAGRTDKSGSLKIDMEEILTEEILDSLVPPLIHVFAGEKKLGVLDGSALLPLYDGHAWDRADESGEIKDYEAYLKRFPDGIHARDAHAEIAFRKCMDIDTADQWMKFTSSFPDSKWLSVAQERIRALTSDDDSDKVVGLNDLCPLEPETKNGYEDGDGCPDEKPDDLILQSTKTDYVWASAEVLPLDKAVAAAADPVKEGVLYLADVSGNIYQYKTMYKKIFILGRVPGFVKDLAAGEGWVLALTTDGNVWLRSGSGSFVLADTGAGSKLSVNSMAQCFLPETSVFLATSKGLLLFRNKKFTTIAGAGPAASVTCDKSGIYVLWEDGGVGNVTVGENVSVLSFIKKTAMQDWDVASMAAFKNALYMVLADGSMFRAAESGAAPFGQGLTGGGKVRRLISTGGPLASLYLVTKSGSVYMLSPDGTSWIPAESGWELLSVRTIVSGPTKTYMLGIAGKSMLLEKAHIEERATFDARLLFGTGKYIPKSEAIPEIDGIAEKYHKMPGVRIRIEGHTDNVGASAKNMDLSYNRANAIAALLYERGVPKWAVTAVGYGETRPIASNKKNSGKAMNRRVDILFISFVTVK